MKPLKIFLSSTYKDLVAEREAVQKVIVRFKQQFIGMEYFHATDETPLEVCLAEVDDADVVILLIAHRYGFIDNKSKLSIVECEYKRAISKRKRLFVYVKSDHSLIPAKHFEDDPSSMQKLKKFKSKIKEKYHVSYFSNTEQLASEVAYSLLPVLNDISNWPQISEKALSSYKNFWNKFQGGIKIFMEAAYISPHKGDVEGGKNINGAAGLLELVPSLAKIKIPFKIISSTTKYINKKGNVLLDGSSGGNRVTKQLLKTISKKIRLPFKNIYDEGDYKKRWVEGPSKEKIYKTEYRLIEDSDRGKYREIIFDYGILSCLKNPFDDNGLCIICSGNHGFGTYACMKYLSSPELMMDLDNLINSTYFQIVVGISPVDVFRFNTIDIVGFAEISYS